jgi:hypothetical protein
VSHYEVVVVVFKWHEKDPIIVFHSIEVRSYLMGVLKLTAPNVQPVGDVQIWEQFPLFVRISFVSRHG